MKIKVCTKCNEEKDIDDFFWRNKSLNKRHSQCKACYNLSRDNQTYYLENKEHICTKTNERHLRLKTENRFNLLKYFRANPCIVCGETNPIVLEFHHVDNNKEYGISNMISNYTWDKILVEIEKCEVLCSNHHKIETSKQFGWWYNNI